MSTRRKIVLALTLSLVGSLGLGAVWQWTAPPYPDRSAYRYDHQSGRLDFIEEVLGEAGLPITEKWVPEFVDRMLRGPSTYRILETTIPTREFALFLPEAIQAAYYAYSAEYQARAPASFQKASRRLVRSWFSYSLGYGVSGFHSYVDSLVAAGDPEVFIYQVIGGQHPDTQWTELLLESNSRWQTCRYWWTQPMDGFLSLTRTDQARLLRWTWSAVMIRKGKTPGEETQEYVEAQWSKRGAALLQLPVVRSMARDAPYYSLYDVLIEELAK